MKEMGENVKSSVWSENLRTDYWISQERKFCEFCKCSISANKASIEFHENGKNHKENVAKRLVEIQKKAAKEAKEALDFDNELKKMEKAALKSYMKDIVTNPDFTSHTIGNITIPDVSEEKSPKKSTLSAGKRPPNKNVANKTVKKWMEALSEEGNPYYWNVDTGESVWEPPEVGFVSLEEQKNKNSNQDSSKQRGNSKFKKKFSKKNKSGCGKKKEDSETIKDEKAVTEYGPIYEGHPYGKWEAVKAEKEEPIDLQLPEQNFEKIVVPSVKEDSERKFKEKKISTPGVIVSSNAETGFKKRKFSSDPKRNMRQRLDND